MTSQFSEEQFEGLADKISERLRKVGLYVDEIAMAEPTSHQFGDKSLLIAMTTVGDIAFSNRVMNPEQDRFDDEFRDIQIEETDAEYDAMKNFMKKNIEEGRDPFDGGEDGPTDDDSSD